MTADDPSLAKVHVYESDPFRTVARPYNPDCGYGDYYLLPARLLDDFLAAELASDRAANAINQYIDSHHLKRIDPDDPEGTTS